MSQPVILVDSLGFWAYNVVIVNNKGANMSTYTYAGYSVGPDGVRKFRVANDPNRARVLEKNGHTEINIVELPHAMDKAAAEAFVAGGVVAAVPQVKQAVKRAVKPNMSAEDRKYLERYWFNNHIAPAMAKMVDTVE